MNQRGAKSPVPPEIALANDVFDQFCAAGSMKTILGHYRHLCDLLSIKPTNYPQFYPKLKSKLKTWKAQALWNKFDKRASHKCYNRGKACSNHRVFIIGAGPCGLRAAIEAQLLGAKVVVLEKRDRFSRNNVLHLWPFVIHDLKSLGAKKFFGKFCAGSIDHISIRQLQCILMKVALILGVEIHEGVGFESLLAPPSNQDEEKIGWRAVVSPPEHPVAQYEFNVLVGADGKRNTLEGFKRKEFRGKLAIAITANFINKKSEAEARVEEISGVAFIFNQKFFKDLYAETGIDLENIVYYKDDTHYFVMTAKKQSLLDKGVILQDFNDTVRLLSQDNIDKDALKSYARQAADFSTDYRLPSLEYAVNHYGQCDVAMFDFTSMYAAENASRFMERHGHPLLMTLVGDSLLEPFWPTGSGCARGFLSSMDACWAVRSWASGNLNPLEVLAERESIYRILGQTTPENLHRDHAAYSVDPTTRYPNLNLRSVLPVQVKGLYDTDDQATLEMYLKAPATMIGGDQPKKRRRRECTVPSSRSRSCSSHSQYPPSHSKYPPKSSTQILTCAPPELVTFPPNKPANATTVEKKGVITLHRRQTGVKESVCSVLDKSALVTGEHSSVNYSQSQCNTVHNKACHPLSAEVRTHNERAVVRNSGSFNHDGPMMKQSFERILCQFKKQTGKHIAGSKKNNNLPCVRNSVAPRSARSVLSSKSKPSRKLLSRSTRKGEVKTLTRHFTQVAQTSLNCRRTRGPASRFGKSVKSLKKLKKSSNRDKSDRSLATESDKTKDAEENSDRSLATESDKTKDAEENSDRSLATESDKTKDAEENSERSPVLQSKIPIRKDRRNIPGKSTWKSREQDGKLNVESRTNDVEIVRNCSEVMKQKHSSSSTYLSLTSAYRRNRNIRENQSEIEQVSSVQSNYSDAQEGSFAGDFPSAVMKESTSGSYMDATYFYSADYFSSEMCTNIQEGKDSDVLKVDLSERLGHDQFQNRRDVRRSDLHKTQSPDSSSQQPLKTIYQEQLSIPKGSNLSNADVSAAVSSNLLPTVKPGLVTIGRGHHRSDSTVLGYQRTLRRSESRFLICKHGSDPSSVRKHSLRMSSASQVGTSLEFTPLKSLIRKFETMSTRGRRLAKTENTSSGQLDTIQLTDSNTSQSVEMGPNLDRVQKQTHVKIPCPQDIVETSIPKYEASDVSEDQSPPQSIEIKKHTAQKSRKKKTADITSDGTHKKSTPRERILRRVNQNSSNQPMSIGNEQEMRHGCNFLISRQGEAMSANGKRAAHGSYLANQSNPDSVENNSTPPILCRKSHKFMNLSLALDRGEMGQCPSQQPLSHTKLLVKTTLACPVEN